MVSAPCARSRARSSSPAGSPSPGAGRASPRLPTRPPEPAAALSGLFSWAGAPRRLPGASRRRRAPRARLKLAGGSGWLRPGRAGRAGRKGLQPRRRPCGREAWPGRGRGARTGLEQGLRSPREVGADGWSGLAPPPLSPSPPPSSPSLSLRRQQVGLGAAAAAAQSSAGGRTEAAGSPGAWWRSLPRDAREAERARRGRARSHPPRPGRPACQVQILAPSRGCRSCLPKPKPAAAPAWTTTLLK
nr:putative uncharacterized protein WWC2-AS2 [Globicephala melas]